MFAPRTILPRSISQLLISLAVAWLVIFIFYERYVPYSNASVCSWPVVKTLSKKPAKLPIEDPVVFDQAPSEPDQKAAIPPAPERRDTKDEEVDFGAQDEPGEAYREMEYAHIMLVADPQLIDDHTYPGRNSLLLSLSQHTVDTYLKKNYRALNEHLRPEHVFFLGDLLDNGRSSTDEYFATQVARFKRIFKKHHSTYTFHTNLPGNHDIGFGDKVKIPERDRFEETFGLTNTMYEICGVQFITLDTVSLSSADKEINKKANEFVQYVHDSPKKHPRILLTHVPLHRDTTKQKCGDLRENEAFHGDGYGYQYQNTLTAEITEEILDKIQPDLIYAGDDHDYCDITHRNGAVREITVKLISMAMGIKYPAIQLLTLILDKEEDAVHYETEICYLPTPYVNVGVYAIMAFLTAFILLFWNIKNGSRLAYSTLPTHSNGADSAHSNNSIKLTNFLRTQDSDQVNSSPLPAYTSTQKPPSQNTVGEKFMLFIKRWSLFEFFKHSAILGSFVVTLYYVGFQLTI